MHFSNKTSFPRIAYLFPSIPFKSNGKIEESIPCVSIECDNFPYEIPFRLNIAVIGFISDKKYHVATKVFFNDTDVSLPNASEGVMNHHPYFTQDGGYAAKMNFTEKFIASEEGYYRIEAQLYEHEPDALPDFDSPPTHKAESYLSISKIWVD